jgi:hypothetical protein
MSKETISRANTLMSQNKSVKERASKFEVSIKRDLQKEVLDTIQTKIETLEDTIFELEDFTLETDLNSGKSAITKAECQERFEKIINAEYQKALLEVELRVKQETFNKYFSK